MSLSFNPFSALMQTDWLRAIQTMRSPTGEAWSRDSDSVQTAYWAAVADTMAAHSARLADLTERESDPEQTVELLPDWEGDFGLPDPCLPLNASLDQRRAALLVRIREGEDPTPAYFVQLAATLGIVVTCTAATSAYGAGWQHVFYINAPSIVSLHAHAGASTAGDYLEVPGNGFLECVIRRATPGHALVIFTYS